MKILLYNDICITRGEQMTVITSLLMLGRRSLGVNPPSSPPVLDTTIGDIEGIYKANPRYVDLSFLGAHDANTGIATRGATPEEVASPALKKFEPVIRNYLLRYVKTQNATVYDLLRYGCRFVHIKVTLFNDVWQTSHSILTGTLERHLTDVLRFLDEKKSDGEIISILFQPIYMGKRSLADMHDAIAEIKYNGKNLFDYVRYPAVDEFKNGTGIKIGDLRYADIVGKNKESGVVLFERRDQHYLPSWDGRESAFPYFFDMDSNALHVWHDHSDLKRLDKAIEKTVSEILSSDKYSDMLRMNQTQPSSCYHTFSDVLYSVYSRSLLQTAKKHNVRLISGDLDRMLTAMPVFQVDFLNSDYGDFNKKINLAIRAYNEKLVKKSL